VVVLHGSWQRLFTHGFWPCAQENVSSACNLFISLGGNISCTITGSRRYLSYLIQGGLEVTCRVIFRGETKFVGSIRKLAKPVIPKNRKLMPSD